MHRLTLGVFNTSKRGPFMVARVFLSSIHLFPIPLVLAGFCFFKILFLYWLPTQCFSKCAFFYTAFLWYIRIFFNWYYIFSLSIFII